MARQITTDESCALELHRHIHCTRANDQKQKLYNAMIAFAEVGIERGMTQTAVDILAFLSLQKDVDTDLSAHGEELLADLEGRVCPRVILDAREFAAEMDLLTMVEYLLDVVQRERN